MPILEIIILILVALLIYNIYKTNKIKNDLQSTQKYKEEYFRNKDYKCKGIEYYNMTVEEKITYVCKDLKPRNQEKVLRYAEKVKEEQEKS